MKKLFYKMFLVILFCMGGGLLRAQLNGTYTINSAAPTGGTNFQTFAAALNALSTVGVNAAVVFNVVANSGPYNENFYLGAIPGSSATNTVRFNGNGNTVQFNATATDPHIVRLTATKFLTLNNFVFKTTSTLGWGASFAGGAELDTIINCIFDLTTSTSTSSANANGITFTGNHTAITSTGTGGRKCYIAKNQILGNTANGSCYNGFRINTGSDSNIIESNLVANFHYYGFYLSSTPGTQIIDNEFHRAGKTTTGIGYGGYVINTSAGSRVIGNRFHSLGGVNGTSTSTTYGIYYATGHGSLAAPGILANNVFYNFNQNGLNYGIYTNLTSHIRMHHNTIVMDVPLTSTAATYGIYVGGNQNNAEYKNNIVHITGGTSGLKYGYYFTSATGAGVSAGGLQRNNVYVNSSQPGAQYHSNYSGINHNNLASFQAANPTLEIGSLDINPDFQNMPLDFIPGPSANALAQNGEQLTALIPLDFNKNVRNIDPTPGAFEMNVEIFDDAGADTFHSPLVFCAGDYPLAVTIKNEGMNDITSVLVNWELNGLPQVPILFTDTLTDPSVNLSKSKALIQLGTGTLVNGPNTIKWWTSLPNNNIIDPISTNDTASVVIYSKESPVVDLGPDIVTCVNHGHLEFLNAGNFGSDYLWDNNYMGAVRTVGTSGTYWVQVTNEHGCTASDTINITFRQNPEVVLPADTSVCLNTALTLDAGNTGIQYYWNNGATSSQMTTTFPGQYYVMVTGANGCIGSDTINIIHNGNAPAFTNIQIQNVAPYTFKFSALNPTNVIGYVWDFGDGTPDQYLQNPTHSYPNSGNYVVTLYASSTCGTKMDTMTVHIYTTGIDEVTIDMNDVLVYPNPLQDNTTVATQNGVLIEKITVFNSIGQLLQIHEVPKKAQYHLELGKFASGMYQIQVTTDKGTVNKKIEIIR